MRFQRDGRCWNFRYIQRKKRGLVSSCWILADLDCWVIPSMCSRAFTLFIPQSAGSRWQQRTKITDVRADGKPCKCVEIWIFKGFWFSFFCFLTGYTKFKGLPSRQSLPSFPPEKHRATAHSCDFYPGYHVADSANHRPALSGFRI